MLVLIAFAGLALLSGCGGGNDPASPIDPYLGTYTLAMFDGSEPPVTRQTGANASFTILGGSLQLRADNTFALNISQSVTLDGVSTSNPIVVEGDYERLDRELELFVPDDGPDDIVTVPASITGVTVITLSFDLGYPVQFTRSP